MPLNYLCLLADLAGYWRHRLEHSKILWPRHEMHHADEDLNATSVFRFHPGNRLTTALIDACAMGCLGFPAWAIFGLALARHYWGMLIHSRLDWTFGALGAVLVSPSMHRWHHAADTQARGKNFATLFSFIDRAFGTLRAPGRRAESTGVDAGPRGYLDAMSPERFRVRLARTRSAPLRQ